MQTRSVLWLTPLAVALAFGCTPKQRGLPNAPIFNTGVRATVIPPGQSAPLMPGQGNMGPTGTATYNTPSGSRYIGGPGAPPPGTPPSAYGNPSEMQMLGGSVTVDTFDIKKPRNALNNNPLLWPLAFVAWPFEKLASAVDGQDDRELLDRRAQAIIESGGAPMYGAQRQQQAQLAQEQAQNDAMERELAARGAGGANAGPQLASAAPSGGAPSIAAELAAQRQRSAAPPRASAGPSGQPSAADETEDRNGDGRVDRWVYGGERPREQLDDDGDGRPDRTVYYEPGGKKIQRVEEDADGDGVADTWVLHQDGRMAQRRADTNHDGQVDTWTFYDASGRIERQAQDLDGDGQRDRAELFENGKLARRTEDTDGDGRPDRNTRFDAKGEPIETEVDEDGDGQIDVRSFYEKGRLVKRQLLEGEAQEATP